MGADNQAESFLDRNRLVRTRRERPCDRPAAEQRDELAASHVGHGGLFPRSMRQTPEGHGAARSVSRA
jgi:hypothetical protein